MQDKLSKRALWITLGLTPFVLLLLLDRKVFGSLSWFIPGGLLFVYWPFLAYPWIVLATGLLVLTRSQPPLRRLAIVTLPLITGFFGLYYAAQLLSRAEVERLTANDMTAPVTPASVVGIGDPLFPGTPDQVLPAHCNALCAQLLFRTPGVREVVIARTTKGARGEQVPAWPIMSFRVEKRDSCGELRMGRHHWSRIDEIVAERHAAGECLVITEGRSEAAEMVALSVVSPPEERPFFWFLGVFDPLRLTVRPVAHLVFARDGDTWRTVYRWTDIEADVPMPLLSIGGRRSDPIVARRPIVLRSIVPRSNTIRSPNPRVLRAAFPEPPALPPQPRRRPPVRDAATPAPPAAPHSGPSDRLPD